VPTLQRRLYLPPLIAAAAFDVPNPLYVDGSLGIQFPGFLYGRILRRVNGERLFVAAGRTT
jgi:hypothetical protein